MDLISINAATAAQLRSTQGNNEGPNEDSGSIGRLLDEKRHTHDGTVEDQGKSPDFGSDGPLLPVKGIMRSKSLAMMKKFAVKDESEDAKLPFLIFHPQAQWRVVWDVTMLLLLVYSAIITPFRMSFVGGFDCTSAWFFLELCFDILFCIDILLSCRTAVVVSGAIDSSKSLDSLQTGTLEILSYYMNPRNLYRGNGGGYFVLDILGSFPVDAVVCSQESSFDFLRVARAPKILKAVRLIRVLRLMRLARVSRIVGKFKDKMSINPAMFAITAFLTLVVVATHWLGCLFFFIGTTMDDEESVFQLENPSQATWSTAYTLQVSYTNETDGSIVNGRHAIYCLRFNGTQLDEGCLEAPTMDQYVASVYWAVASLCTVGYGDVRARTTDEFAVAIFVMLAGGFCFAYMVGGLSVMLERVTTKNKVLKDKLYEVDGFSHREKLPRPTTREIRKHLTKTETNKYNIPSIIRSMHGSIKNEMFLLLYEDLVRRVPFFKNFSDRAIVDLVTRFEYVGVPAGETFYRQGSIGEKIYFLRSGTVRMSMDNTESRAVTWQVQAPGFFGEKCLSDHNKFRLATAETVTWCNCFMLRTSDIQDTCNRYPDAEIAVAEFKQKFESRWRKAIGKVRGQIKLNYASRTEAQRRSLPEDLRAADANEVDSTAYHGGNSSSIVGNRSMRRQSLEVSMLPSIWGVEIRAKAQAFGEGLKSMFIKTKTVAPSRSRSPEVKSQTTVNGAGFGQGGDLGQGDAGSGAVEQVGEGDAGSGAVEQVGEGDAGSGAVEQVGEGDAGSGAVEQVGEGDAGSGAVEQVGEGIVTSLPGAVEETGVETPINGDERLENAVANSQAGHASISVDSEVAQGQVSGSDRLYSGSAARGAVTPRDTAFARDGVAAHVVTSVEAEEAEKPSALAANSAVEVTSEREARFAGNARWKNGGGTFIGGKNAVEILHKEKREKQEAEWRSRCRVQATLSDEMEFLKAHTNKLRKVTESYAGRVESQLKLIQRLEAQVKELDPDWGKRKQGPIVTDMYMYDQDESRH